MLAGWLSCIKYSIYRARPRNQNGFCIAAIQRHPLHHPPPPLPPCQPCITIVNHGREECVLGPVYNKLNLTINFGAHTHTHTPRATRLNVGQWGINNRQLQEAQSAHYAQGPACLHPESVSVCMSVAVRVCVRVCVCVCVRCIVPVHI